MWEGCGMGQSYIRRRCHAVACILADLSYRNGCRMEYDDKKMEVKKSPIER
jgi:uncharacterized protein (UPF0303 family)